MTKTEHDKSGPETGLDAYFDAGRAAAPVPSAGLLARVVADAGRIADARAGMQASGPAARQPLGAGLWAAIGGWPAMAGLAAATVAGVWIGFAQPAGVDLLAQGLLGLGGDGYLVDLAPGFDSLLAEG